jgi:ABC-2 type transport system permease protein
MNRLSVKGWTDIFRREFAGYFATPIATVFLIIFLIACSIFTFYVGGFFARGQADLQPFFESHPWLFLLFAPAVAMRLWSDERRTGTIESLLTLPITTAGAVLGKFLAAWAFTTLALLLTFPLWITVNILGEPDNGVILAGYIGSIFIMGGYLAIGSCISALTRAQVLAFIVSVLFCFIFLMMGLPLITDTLRAWAPLFVVNTASALSMMSHVSSIGRGVLDVRDLIYFTALIITFLIATTIIIDAKREQL